LPWRTSVTPSKPRRGRAPHGLALRVEDLGLEHDVDDDTGHELALEDLAGGGHRQRVDELDDRGYL
jgi:hypothetical protein